MWLDRQGATLLGTTLLIGAVAGTGTSPALINGNDSGRDSSLSRKMELRQIAAGVPATSSRDTRPKSENARSVWPTGPRRSMASATARSREAPGRTHTLSTCVPVVSTARFHVFSCS